MMEHNSLKDYQILTTLGSSLFGTVYKARRIKDNAIVSIKEYSRYQEGAIETFNNDINYYKELECDNIVKQLHTNQTDDNLYIIREYCSGTLDEFIQCHNNNIPINEIQKILKQLMVVFQKLDEKQLIHRDIKPSNIFFSFKGLKDFQCKLSGIYLCTKEGKIESKDLITGTRYITPPEGIKGEKITMKYDLWSVGVLIYYMIKGKYPFEGKRDKMLLNNIDKGINLKDLSGDNDLDDLLGKCLQKDLDNRISWNDFFEHNFFKKKFSEKKKGKGKMEDLIIQLGDIKTWYDENRKTHLELIKRYSNFMYTCELKKEGDEFNAEVNKLIKRIQKNLKVIFEKN